jgi:hypothetical protein
LIARRWYWRDLADIRAFAGDDITVARFFPDDDRYLIDREAEGPPRRRRPVSVIDG